MSSVSVPPSTPAAEMTSNGPYECVVLGSGVLGLSIAHELADKGVKVAVVARDLPEDSHSTGFASPWAGANWQSFAVDDPAERRRDEITFHRFGKLAETIPDLVTRTQFKFVWKGDIVNIPEWYRDIVFDYKPLSPEELPKGFRHGVGFTSYSLNTPLYLAHLGTSLREKGVPIIRQRVSSLDEAYAIPAVGDVPLVINATGLGARTLLGVEDTKVYPAKGQTVTVKAPSVRVNWGIKDPHPLADRGQRFYIIPRPGPEGHVTLGGTFIAHDYSTLPDPETAERMLRETYELCPDLAEGRGSWEGIEVVSHNVGLRPCREGGMRLELERRKVGQGMENRKGMIPPSAQKRWGQDVGCVHAYGIGPAGYQASLGIAEEASGLALDYLGKMKNGH